MNRRQTAIVIAVGIAVLAIGARAPGQSTSSQNRLRVLRIQNAYQQQQTALETAAQQTNLLIQRAVHQASTPESAFFLRPLDFQAQQSALQIAQAQTRALALLTLNGRSFPNQAILLQLAGLEAALQRSVSLEAAVQIQNAPLTPDQIQSLFAEQANLMNLLAFPAPNTRAMPAR
jgi:hypothetical protein